MQYIPNLRSKLFLLAHELMQKERELPISSYAVAIWYLFTKKYSLSRRWIRYSSRCDRHLEPEGSDITICSTTTRLNPHNAPAQIAFAHTFALEGEHDQAVTAYSTCVRLFHVLFSRRLLSPRWLITERVARIFLSYISAWSTSE